MASLNIVAYAKHHETPYLINIFMYPFSKRYFVKRNVMTEENIFPYALDSDLFQSILAPFGYKLPQHTFTAR